MVDQAQPSNAPADLPAGTVDLLRSVREQRFNGGVYCLHCSSPKVQRWGTFRGRQRYRCRTCRRTFSDLTGTPMYRTKRLAAWPAYFGCLQRSATIRGSALLLHVHPTTTFRWRHRYLDAVRRSENLVLAGDVEVIDFRLPYSEKGARNLARRPWPRGLEGLRFTRSPHRYERVLHAVDRAGRTSMLLTGRARPPRIAEIGALLDPHAEQIRRIIARGEWFSEMTRYAWVADAAFVRVRPDWRERVTGTSEDHLLNAARSIRRFKEWLNGFRGVASKYLPNYVAWRRLLDGTEEELLAPRWLAFTLSPPTLSANTA